MWGWGGGRIYIVAGWTLWDDFCVRMLSVLLPSLPQDE